MKKNFWSDLTKTSKIKVWPENCGRYHNGELCPKLTVSDILKNKGQTLQVLVWAAKTVIKTRFNHTTNMSCELRIHLLQPQSKQNTYPDFPRWGYTEVSDSRESISARRASQYRFSCPFHRFVCEHKAQSTLHRTAWYRELCRQYLYLHVTYSRNKTSIQNPTVQVNFWTKFGKCTCHREEEKTPRTLTKL